MSDPVAYKILTTAEFAQLRRDGAFRGSAADMADGFVHLSSGAQIAATLDTHYGGRTDLVIAAVDLARLGDRVRWEASRGGQMFPHLYGVLAMDAVIAAGPLRRAADGSVQLPG